MPKSGVPSKSPWARLRTSSTPSTIKPIGVAPLEEEFTWATMIQVRSRKFAGREIEPDAQIHHRNQFPAQVDDPLDVGRHLRNRGDFHQADDLTNLEHRQSVELVSQQKGQVLAWLCQEAGGTGFRSRCHNARSVSRRKRPRRRFIGILYPFTSADFGQNLRKALRLRLAPGGRTFSMISSKLLVTCGLLRTPQSPWVVESLFFSEVWWKCSSLNHHP